MTDLQTKIEHYHPGFFDRLPPELAGEIKLAIERAFAWGETSGRVKLSAVILPHLSPPLAPPLKRKG